MIIYWISLLGAVGGYLYFVWSLAKRKVGPLFSFRKEWIKEKKIPVSIGLVFTMVLVTVIFYKPLGKTIWCAYKGYEHSVQTRRDWISGVCSYKGPNGAWIPINRLLGFPEGDSEKNKGVDDGKDSGQNHQ